MLCGIGSRMIAATSPGMLGHGLRDRLEIVERDDERRVDDLGDDARREGILVPHAVGPGDHVHGHRVVPAVVAALELDHVAAAGDAGASRTAWNVPPTRCCVAIGDIPTGSRLRGRRGPFHRRAGLRRL